MTASISTRNPFSAYAMAELNENEPFHWDVERVIKELCTPERTWDVPASYKLPDPEWLASKLRELEADGETLLIYPDEFGWHTFWEILGVNNSAIQEAIKQFRKTSTLYYRERKRTTDDVNEARVKKQRRTDETEKTVASGSDHARTTRSKKHWSRDKKQEKIEGTGDSRHRWQYDCPTRRPGAQVRGGHHRFPTRRQSKRMSLRDAALGSRADRLATLRPRVNNKAVVGVSSSCRF